MELERGNTKNPSLDLLSKLAEFYDVSIDYLAGREEDYKDSSIQNFARSLSKNNLSDEDLEILKQTAERFAQPKK